MIKNNALQQSWDNTAHRVTYYTSPCVIARMLNEDSPTDKGVQLGIAPQNDGAFNIIFFEFYLQRGTSNKIEGSEKPTQITSGLNAGQALKYVFTRLDLELSQAKDSTQSRVQVWKARTPSGLDHVKPLSSLAAITPDFLPEFHKLSSRWGQKASPFTGTPKMGRKELEFLFR